jgi:Flp pilus assembly protein TadB
MATIQEQLDQLSALIGSEAEFLNTTKADKTAVLAAVATLEASIAAQATAQGNALAAGLAAQYQSIMGATENDMDTFGEVRAWIQANVSAIQAISDRVKLTVQSLSPGEKTQVQTNLDVPSNARVNDVESVAAAAVSAAAGVAAAATAAVGASVTALAAAIDHQPTKDYRLVVKAHYPSRYPA